MYLLSIVYSLSSRDGVLTATYSEILSLSNHGINYFDRPIIITQSVQSNWTLVNNLANIFDDDYRISVQKQTTNCSCLSEIYSDSIRNNETDKNSLCKHYGQTVPYKQTYMQFYEYWNRFEGKHKISGKGVDCVEFEKVETSVGNGIKELNRIEKNGIYDDDIDNNDTITSLRTYFSLLGFKNNNEKNKLQISDLQLNSLDHISLAPFFKLFDTNGLKSYSDIRHMNIWYATEYYRAVRHFDKANNLFFVLKGSRHFRISQPTSIVFEMYPFLHESNRHQLPNYPYIDGYREGIPITDTKYKIFESTIYENEVLYLPGYWFHEVINNNVTIVMNIWWNSNDLKLYFKLMNMKKDSLPINPNHEYLDSDTFEMHKHGIDGFLYFVQNLIDKWCKYAHKYCKYHGQMRCTSDAFLLYNFMSTYEDVLNNLTFDNFEWYSIIIDTYNILKCTQNRIVDIDDLIDLKQFMFVCNDIQQVYKTLWDESINDVMSILDQYNNIMIAESDLVQFLENVLFASFGDTNIIPIVIKLINL